MQRFHFSFLLFSAKSHSIWKHTHIFGGKILNNIFAGHIVMGKLSVVDPIRAQVRMVYESGLRDHIFTLFSVLILRHRVPWLATRSRCTASRLSKLAKSDNAHVCPWQFFLSFGRVAKLGPGIFDCRLSVRSASP